MVQHFKRVTSSVGLVSTFEDNGLVWYQIFLFFPYEAATGIGYFFELSYQSGLAIWVQDWFLAGMKQVYTSVGQVCPL
jgi:hypothetical protein